MQNDDMFTPQPAPAKPKNRWRTPLIVIVCVAVFAGFIYTIFSFATGAMKNSGAYKEAVRVIEKDSVVLAKTGGIKGYDDFVTGNISTVNGDAGNANLTIGIKGQKADADVNVTLVKSNGIWSVTSMAIQ